MLRVAADFPHPGSAGFLMHSGDPVRIVRHNPGGTTYISKQAHAADPLIGRLASGSTTVPTDSIVETFGEATGLNAAGRPLRKLSRPSSKPAERERAAKAPRTRKQTA